MDAVRHGPITPVSRGVDEPEEARERAEWFYGQRAYPNQQTPPGALAAASPQQPPRATAYSPPAATSGVPAGGVNWTEIGPKPIASFRSGYAHQLGQAPGAGRVTAAVNDPAAAGVAYAAGAFGGVWKTSDAGASWQPKSEGLGTLSMGALAMDANDHTVVYAGTGEQNQSADSYYGLGVYRSTDSGATWAKLAGTTFDGCFIGDVKAVGALVLVAVTEWYGGQVNPACHA